jgi:hypothetical protein
VERKGRLGLDELEEVVSRDRDAVHFARRTDARDARPVLDEERELAEEVARAELERPRAELDGDGALPDHVHAGTRVVRQREDLPRRAGDLGRAGGDAREPLLADPVEGREPAKVLDVHGRSISASFEGAGTVARMRAPDVLLPLYGEDRERGDLRD